MLVCVKSITCTRLKVYVQFTKERSERFHCPNVGDSNQKLQSQSHSFRFKKKTMETCKRGNTYSAPSILFTDLLYPFLEIAERAHEI